MSGPIDRLDRVAETNTVFARAKAAVDAAFRQADLRGDDEPVLPGFNPPIGGSSFTAEEEKAILDATIEEYARRGVVNWGATADDPVNHPSHYTTGGIECIDAMQAMLSREEFIGYLRGKSFKYRWRFRHKGKAIEDLQKAEWYDRRLLDLLMQEDDQ